MSSLKSVFSKSLPSLRSRLQSFRQSHGSNTIAQVTFNHLFTGLNVPILFHATARLDPEKGLFLRSIPIREISTILPKTEPHSIQPTIESIFWLLLTGEVPTVAEVDGLKSDLSNRSFISEDLERFIKDLPNDLSPMAQYSMALLYMSRSSICRQKVANFQRDSKWELLLEDGLDLLAKSSGILLQISKNRNNPTISPQKTQSNDWCGRLAESFGLSTSNSHDFLRLFAQLHVDHEGGNVSTHTTMAVSSTHADPFSAYSAGVNGLSGALHGYANRDVMLFLLSLMQELGSNVSKEAIEAYVLNWRKHKGNIPGFGHAILRTKDLRFCIFEEWGIKHCAEAQILQVNRFCAEIVSQMLKKQGKAKLPYPNVDFISGSLLFHYGIKDIELYPVFFAVVRAFGCVANMVIERALGLPLEYPLSWDLATIEKILGK